MSIKKTLATGALGAILTVGGTFDASAQDTDNNQKQDPTEVTQDIDLSALPATTVIITVDGASVGGRDYARSIATAGIKTAQDAKDFADSIIEKLENGTMTVPRSRNTSELPDDHVPHVKIDIRNGRSPVHTIEQDLGDGSDKQAPTPETPEGP